MEGNRSESLIKRSLKHFENIFLITTRIPKGKVMWKASLRPHPMCNSIFPDGVGVSQVRTVGCPRVSPSRSGPWSGIGGGIPTTRAAQRVLATRLAVWVLRSRGSTFLLLIKCQYSEGIFCVAHSYIYFPNYLQLLTFTLTVTVTLYR